jgi:hypothetical protein
MSNGSEWRIATGQKATKGELLEWLSATMMNGSEWRIATGEKQQRLANGE